MKDLVLLTGASAGIGYEMARQLAAKKLDLVLVARRIDKLNQLKIELEKQHGVAVHVFQKDLSEARNAIVLYQEIKQQGLNITMLVNNAGVGMYGKFEETNLEQELAMIELNVASVVALTKLAVTDFKKAGRGRILNMASLLSFFPFPYYTVYAATKAFILSFSEALRTELAGTGITVTAISPGPTDSEFTTDGMWKTNAYKSLKLTAPADVATQAVKALLKGRGTVIVGLQNMILANTPRFSPRWLTLRINKHMASPA